MAPHDRGGRRQNLRVAAGWNVAQPQTAQAVVVLHVQNVLAVGRDGGFLGLARVGDLRHGEILEWGRAAACEECIDAECADSQKSQCYDDDRGEAEFVLTSDCADAGAAGG